MILDARTLSTMQSCPRRFLLESDYDVLRWRPKSLFDACLRKGIAAISNDDDAATVAESLKAEFLQVAANPGIEVTYGANPYVIARDYCAMLDTVLRAAAGWGLPKLSDAPATRFWEPLAFTGEDGQLHRIITVDRWTDDNLSREAHSWYVTGDIAATRMAMTLHVVEIGQQRNGRRASAWARAWQHPAMPRLKLRFAHKDGSTFKGWTPVYLADHRDLDADEWVAKMTSEGATDALTRHIGISVPDDTICDDTMRQIMIESSRASVLLSERGSGPWRAVPMSRAACDAIVPCPWQQACYASVNDITSFGLYSNRCSAKVATVMPTATVSPGG